MKKPTDPSNIGRLALRIEGENWNAYFADTASMKDAVFLGSIKLAMARSPVRKEQFMSLMRDCVADLIEDKTGIRPIWTGMAPAPEHERTKE